MIKLTFYILQIIGVLLMEVGSLAFAAEMPCPLGANEDRLTIQRIMRNLGRYIRDAESTALKGKQWPQAVSDAELKKSISDLEIVIACAEQSQHIENPDLLPRKTQEFIGADRESYLQAYVVRMQKFISQTQEFKAMFEHQLRLSAESRNFVNIFDFSRLMNHHIDESHSTLSCWQALSP